MSYNADGQTETDIVAVSFVQNPKKNDKLQILSPKRSKEKKLEIFPLNVPEYSSEFQILLNEKSKLTRAVCPTKSFLRSLFRVFEWFLEKKPMHMHSL